MLARIFYFIISISPSIIEKDIDFIDHVRLKIIKFLSETFFDIISSKSQ